MAAVGSKSKAFIDCLADSDDDGLAAGRPKHEWEPAVKIPRLDGQSDVAPAAMGQPSSVPAAQASGGGGGGSIAPNAAAHPTRARSSLATVSSLKTTSVGLVIHMSYTGASLYPCSIIV